MAIRKRHTAVSDVLRNVGTGIFYLVGAAFSLAVLIMVARLGILHWQHPDMTDRRFFLTYWRSDLALIAAITAAYISFAIGSAIEDSE